MRQLAGLLDKMIKCQGDSRIFDLQDGDFLQWGRHSRFTGLVLDSDVLMLGYSHSAPPFEGFQGLRRYGK